MTTAAPETKNSNGSPDVATSKVESGKLGTKLTIERARSIGWYFIESYYELYNKNIESLYKLYNLEASITHSESPSQKNQVTCQAKGTESVKSLFNDLKSNQTKNKIIITNADIQICLGDNILIVVSGEWSKNGGDYYQFIQSFVLCPGINETTFDIANDVLKFINHEFNHDLIVETPKLNGKANGHVSEQQQQQQQQPTADGKPEEQKEKLPNKSSESEKPVKNENIKETTPVKEETPAETPEPKSSDDEPVKSKETGSEKDSIPPQESVSSPQQEELSTESSSGPISWAALAATARQKSPTTKPATISGTSPSQVNASTTSKTTSPSVANNKKPATQVPVALPNGKYKKEDWFPIYIRGCEELNEKVLKEHLVKQFGDIKFFRQNTNIALCDFFESEGQKKALETGKTTVSGITVSLEVRESKGLKKSDKDIKKDSKTNDPKRKNDSKKQQPSKKKS